MTRDAVAQHIRASNDNDRSLQKDDQAFHQRLGSGTVLEVTEKAVLVVEFEKADPRKVVSASLYRI